jgi:copper(I)-binding protein
MRMLLGLFLSLVISLVHAESIEFSPAWSRVTSAKLDVGGVFVNISNNSKKDDVLISATTSRVKKVEIHETINDHGVMRMRELKDGIKIPKGATVELKPGTLHIMLLGINEPLKLNDEFDLTLSFKNGKSKKVKVIVNNGIGMINGQDFMSTHTHHH